MGGRGGASGMVLNAVSKERGVKNYTANQTFYKAKPNGSYEKQKGSTFFVSGRQFGIHTVTGLSAGKFMVTDVKTGMGVGLSHTVSEAVSLARKNVKKINSYPELAEREKRLKKFQK